MWQITMSPKIYGKENQGLTLLDNKTLLVSQCSVMDLNTCVDIKDVS